MKEVFVRDKAKGNHSTHAPKAPSTGKDTGKTVEQARHKESRAQAWYPEKQIHIALDQIARSRKWLGSRKSEFWTAAATVAIALFTVGLVAVSYWQWKELHGAGAQTDRLINLYQQQLEQTKAQTNMMREQMEGVYGAVIISSMDMSYDNGLTLNFYNAGQVKSPSTNLDLNVYQQKFPGSRPSKPLVHYTRTFVQVIPVPANTPANSFLTFARIMDISKNTWEELHSTNPPANFVVEGTISYDTGFGRIITEPVCWVNFYFPPYPMVSGQVFPAQNGMVQCREYDSAYIHARRQREQSERR